MEGGRNQSSLNCQSCQQEDILMQNIDQNIEKMKEFLPHLSGEQIISILRGNMQELKKKQQKYTNKISNTLKKNIKNITIKDQKDNQSDKEQDYLVKEEYKTDQNECMGEKIMIAKIFLQSRYGFDKYKDYFWQNYQERHKMNNERYKIILKEIFLSVYIRIQQFLIKECKRFIQPLINSQLRPLYPILVKSMALFEQNQYLTLKKFIKIVYMLGHTSIYEEAALKLYIRIQSLLRGKIGSYRLDKRILNKRQNKPFFKRQNKFLNRRVPFSSKWSYEMECDLIIAVQLNKNLPQARNALRVKYRQHPIMNDVRGIKERYYKILRIVMQRLKQYAREYADRLPPLISLREEARKAVLRSTKAIQCRQSLAKLYKMEDLNFQTISKSIDDNNTFCTQNIRKISSSAVKTSPHTFSDEIAFNISTSRGRLMDDLYQKRIDNSLIIQLQKEGPYQHIIHQQEKGKLHFYKLTRETQSDKKL